MCYFIVGEQRLKSTIKGIEEELEQRLKFFEDAGKLVEAQRLKGRVEFDLEMLGATGMCKGIENYARYLTGQKPGETPYSLFDYYESKGKDYLVIVDESHVSLPQFRGMFAGDRSRKETLVEYGFRLPSALDNRPLMVDEFINKKAKFLFVSATPNDYELDLSRGAVYEQILRPTGLLDPQIILKDSDNQVEILHDMAKEVIARGERILVTVLTKKMAEELSKYYLELGLKVKYMHSDIDAIERNELIRGLRSGEYDMLIGINLLRELGSRNLAVHCALHEVNHLRGLRAEEVRAENEAGALFNQDLERTAGLAEHLCLRDCCGREQGLFKLLSGSNCFLLA